MSMFRDRAYRLAWGDYKSDTARQHAIERALISVFNEGVEKCAVEAYSMHSELLDAIQIRALKLPESP